MTVDELSDQGEVEGLRRRLDECAQRRDWELFGQILSTSPQALAGLSHQQLFVLLDQWRAIADEGKQWLISIQFLAQQLELAPNRLEQGRLYRLASSNHTSLAAEVRAGCPLPWHSDPKLAALGDPFEGLTPEACKEKLEADAGMYCLRSSILDPEHSETPLPLLPLELLLAQISLVNETALEELTTEVLLRPEDRFFEEVFGAAAASFLQFVYDEHSAPVGREVIQKLRRSDLHRAVIERIEGADSASANWCQRSLLEVMQQPVPFYSVEVPDALKGGYERLWSFVEVNGKARWLGNLPITTNGEENVTVLRLFQSGLGSGFDPGTHRGSDPADAWIAHTRRRARDQSQG